MAVSLRETLRAYDAANARLVKEIMFIRNILSYICISFVQNAEPVADVVPLLVAQHKQATQVYESIKQEFFYLKKINNKIRIRRR